MRVTWTWAIWSSLTVAVAGGCGGTDHSDRIDGIVGLYAAVQETESAWSSSIARGEDVYETSCAECHDAGTMGAPDFREGGGDAHADDEYVDVVLHGLFIRMPGFGDELSDQEVADVLAAIRAREAGGA